MRILYVLTSLGVGGAETQTVALAEGLAARGHSVALLSLKHADHELPVKLPVMRLNLRKNPAGIWKGLRFARSFIELFRPEIVHSHTFPANIFARLQMLPLLRPKLAPVVVNTIHNVYEGGWHRKLVYLATGRLVDKITAVSQAAAQAHPHIGRRAETRIRIVMNGIDTSLYVSDPKRRARARARVGVEKHFLWLAVGRVVKAKDYPNLLRAWAVVKGSHPEARLWIAGEGDPQPLFENEFLKGESDLLDVRWLGLRDDVIDLLNVADGYVLSSAWEGMPLAVAEAMAMEMPVVATDAGGVRELLADTGILVPRKDSSALAAAMLDVMAMEKRERAMMGVRARVRAEACFSLEAALDTWEHLYAKSITL